MAANSEASSSRPKLACLCSPTNHPGSFRCIRHRPSPRARLSSFPPSSSPSSSSSGGVASARGEGRAAAAARAKGRSVRAHLLRMISSSNSPSGRRRRRGDFQPRPSRLRQCAS